jgi:uncharacterized protein YndB with AHSA1/START domain
VETLATTVNHSTFTIERNYPATPERVFAAFADPAKKRRWFADGERFRTESFAMDFRVGGHETTRSVTAPDSPLKGASMTNETVYQDIVPNKRIVLAYTMAVNDARISASLSTFEFLPVAEGTRLLFTEQTAFFENSDGPEIRQIGWSKLIDRLGVQLAN